MEAIWIVHCPGSGFLEDDLRGSLETIVQVISSAFTDFQEYKEFEVVYDPIIPMIPSMKGRTSAGQPFEIGGISQFDV